MPEIGPGYRACLAPWEQQSEQQLAATPDPAQLALDRQRAAQELSAADRAQTDMAAVAASASEAERVHAERAAEFERIAQAARAAEAAVAALATAAPVS